MKAKANVNMLFTCESEKDAKDLLDALSLVKIDGSISNRQSKYKFDLEIIGAHFDDAFKINKFLMSRGHGKK